MFSYTCLYIYFFVDHYKEPAIGLLIFLYRVFSKLTIVIIIIITTTVIIIENFICRTIFIPFSAPSKYSHVASLCHSVSLKAMAYFPLTIIIKYIHTKQGEDQQNGSVTVAVKLF